MALEAGDGGFRELEWFGEEGAEGLVGLTIDRGGLKADAEVASALGMVLPPEDLVAAGFGGNFDTEGHGGGASPGSMARPGPGGENLIGLVNRWWNPENRFCGTGRIS